LHSLEKTMASILYLDKTASTNEYLQSLLETREIEAGTAAVTFCQTKGRGQQGNRWLSEFGKNISYSLLIKPEFIPARIQFIISQLIALTVKSFLDEYTKGISIKWPNDIYHQDKKIAGILIENKLEGSLIAHSVIGIGLNINQTTFPAELPNPVSLIQLTDSQYDLKDLSEKLHHQLLKALENLNTDKEEEIQRFYVNNLYRRDGFHNYSDASGAFSAKIRGVSAQGKLILEHESGTVKEYAFKEVAYI
jgi:BirA family transcriptional regulator, biotin operon repressor / biotin---[acetyl-CoA-carboxylase] ligase